MTTPTREPLSEALPPGAIPVPSCDLNHPWRIALTNEVHSRPFMDISAPTAVSNLVVFAEDDNTRHHALLRSLCQHFGVTPPADNHRHFSYDFGDFRLKWEHHTEFSSYTLARPHTGGAPFSAPPHLLLPQSWLQQLAGLVMVATQVHVERHDGSDYDSAMLHEHFSGLVIAGANAVGARSEVWADFRIQADGFSRFLVRDRNLLFMQTGRLVQRLVEIETYRVMALLALPQAQAHQPKLRAIEEELSRITLAMESAHTPAQEQPLMQTLIALASRVEGMMQASNYRFGAAEAYWRIVKARIADIREERIEGSPTIAEFMERRLVPAIEFCRTVAERQHELADRVAHASDLLRTRVSITQEAQNSAILASMDRRAHAQLRLQQAVEGFSTVAITYYLIGLIGYLAKGLKVLGVEANPERFSALSIPIVAAATWLLIKRLRHSLTQGALHEQPEHPATIKTAPSPLKPAEQAS